jgi:hypothetical protein
MRSIENNAVIRCENVVNLENSIISSFTNKDLVKNQSLFLEKVGISVDGKMHSRIVDKILSLC